MIDLIQFHVFRREQQIYWELLELMYQLNKFKNFCHLIRYFYTFLMLCLYDAKLIFNKLFFLFFYSIKLGVNGYSFLVDNNGRVLYHPDLRPLVRFERQIICVKFINNFFYLFVAAWKWRGEFLKFYGLKYNIYEKFFYYFCLKL